VNYIYLLLAAAPVCFVHFYIVWRHRDNRRYSISEHAVLARSSSRLYLLAHINCDVFYLLFSYNFFLVDHHLAVVFWLNVAFAVLDFVQAVLPSKGKTEKAHFAAAYISWCCYLLAGIVALYMLHVSAAAGIIAVALLVPILGMFFYMHINRAKLYPYQLAIVPLFVVYMLVVMLGADTF
jgi:Flp pilus assembly protein TadB